MIMLQFAKNQNNLIVLYGSVALAMFCMHKHMYSKHTLLLSRSLRVSIVPLYAHVDECVCLCV